MNVNRVILCGCLGHDPEQTKIGARLSLATSRRYKDKTGAPVQETEWHSVTLFGRQAEIAMQYLQKGSEVYIEGRIHSYKYTGRDGVERRAYEIVADHMILGARPKDAAASPGGSSAGTRTPSQQAEAFADEDVPF